MTVGRPTVAGCGSPGSVGTLHREFLPKMADVLSSKMVEQGMGDCSACAAEVKVAYWSDRTVSREKSILDGWHLLQ